MSLSAVIGTAQTRFIAPSVDPEGDSLAIVRVRAKMVRLRRPLSRSPVGCRWYGGRDPGRNDVLDKIIPVEMADTDLKTLFFVHVGLTDISRQRKMETGLGLIDGLRVQLGGRTGDPVDESAEPALLRPGRNKERDGGRKGN